MGSSRATRAKIQIHILKKLQRRTMFASSLVATR